MCNKCGANKESSEFYERKNGSFRKTCKSCMNCASKVTNTNRKNNPRVTVYEKICRVCRKNLLTSNFVKSNTLDGFSNRCKCCDSEYRKNTNRDKEKLRNNSANYRSKHKNEISDRKKLRRISKGDELRSKERVLRIRKKMEVFDLLGSSCSVCGFSDPDSLCVDHVDNDGNHERKTIKESQKLFTLILSRKVELNRYQLLCANHNREKHIKYVNSLPKNDDIENQREKKCSICGQSKKVGEFVKDKYKSMGRKSECKSCSSSRSFQRKVKSINALGGKCVNCGNDNIDHLEIDHINNDGNIRRKNGDDINIYLKILSGIYDSSHLQVLCCNCNLRKQINGGILF